MSSDHEQSEPTMVTVRTLTKYELSSQGGSHATSASSTPTNRSSVSNDSGGDKRKSLIYNDGQFSITLHHYDSIVGELKCPGCAQPLYGPIFLCQTGHSICSHCSSRVSSCSLCKKKLTEMRNYTLEAIAAKVQFTCPYAARGCTVRLPLQLLWWHKDRCGYKQIECFMGKVWENCSWHGSEKDWIEHCVSEHQDKLYNSPDIVLTWNYAADSQRCIQLQSVIAYYAIRAYGEFFNVYHIYDQNSRRTIWTVICASKDSKTSQRFAFELELYSPIDSAKLLVQRFPCHSESDADFLKDGNCAKIALEEAIRFMTNEKTLYYRVRIVEVTPSRSRSLVLVSSTQKLQMPTTQLLPIDYGATKIEHSNMKAVPEGDIIVRGSGSTGDLTRVHLDPDLASVHSHDSSNSSTIVNARHQLELPEDDQDLVTCTAKATSTPILNRVNSFPKPPRVQIMDTPIDNASTEQQLVRCRILERQDSIKMKTIYSGEASGIAKSSSKASCESLNTPPKGLSKFYNVSTYKASKLWNKMGIK